MSHLDLTAEHHERQYVATADAIVHARNHAAGWVAAGGLAERVRLIVGELAANAVLHAGTPFSVFLQVGAEWVRIEVRDGSSDPPVMRRPDPLALDGRGLHLVHGLSIGWGSIPTADGKIVWAQLPNTHASSEQRAALSAAARRRSVRQVVQRRDPPAPRRV